MIDVPLTVRPDDPLFQLTRAHLFALLGELGRPAGTVELAQRLGLHPNGVRIHLERLEHAGLRARDRPPQARGRPRDAWTIAPDARPGGHAPSAYGQLWALAGARHAIANWRAAKRRGDRQARAGSWVAVRGREG